MSDKPTQEDINAFCQAAGEKRNDALLDSMLEKYGDAILHGQHKPGGSTPLGYAANYGHRDLAEKFIKRGADVNQGDFDNFTPLMSASWHTSNVETAQLLLDHGAIIDCEDAYGHTPRMVAQENKMESVIAAIDATVQKRAGETVQKVAQQGTAQPIAPLKKIRLKT
ncbi:MAG: ankyrin repeat domain-containing protein [Alphaproteobacteria bacterium]